MAENAVSRKVLLFFSQERDFRDASFSKKTGYAKITATRIYTKTTNETTGRYVDLFLGRNKIDMVFSI